MTEKLLNDCKVSIKEFTRNLIKKLNDPALHIELNPGKIHSLISSFMESDPSKKDKMELNFIFRQEIKSYLRSGSASRLKDLESASDPQIFLQIIGDFWANFQRFTFGLQFICSQANTFFVSSAKYLQKMSGGKYQLGAIPIVAVNQLKEYMENMNLTKKFTKVFCDFVANERLGKNVPRELVKQGIQFFESNYHDYDAVCNKVGDRVLIIKKINHDAPPHRHSTADKFFRKFIIDELLKSCRVFYSKFTTEKSGPMNATEQVLQMIKFIEEEEKRATFYIHEDKNVDQYMKCIYENLIELNLPERINKPSGLSKYFAQYNHTKSDYEEQIKNFWKIYSRIFSFSKKNIIEIYVAYFEEQGKSIINLMEKPPQFINAVINLNKKNLSIVNMLGGMLQFDRIRVQSIEKILSCEMIKGSKFEGKYFLGAKHLAAILHQKIKTKYAKEEKYGEDEADLMNIFKILKYKTIAIKELTKFLNSRLLQEIDMSKDAQYINSMSLETRIIEQIKKQSSQNDVKNLQQCLKDITKSEQMTNKLKQSEIGKKFHFLNQIIIKNNTFWNESTFFDIEPPNVLRNCISETINYIEKNANIQFQLFNGVSTVRSTMTKGKYTFQIKNIYVVILLHVDERPNKKMYYGDIIDKIKPTGRMKEKAYLQLSRYLIEMTNFGLLKSNKSLNKDSPNLQTCEGSDFFEINKDFAPVKKVAIIKTPMMTALPDHIKKAFAIKSKSLDEDEKQYEKDRKVYVEAICVKQLKHAHHNGGGTVTFDECLQHFQQGRARELNVNAKYLKETVQVLINKKYCERVEGKKNTLKYIA